MVMVTIKQLQFFEIYPYKFYVLGIVWFCFKLFDFT